MGLAASDACLLNCVQTTLRRSCTRTCDVLKKTQKTCSFSKGAFTERKKIICTYPSLCCINSSRKLWGKGSSTATTCRHPWLPKNILCTTSSRRRRSNDIFYFHWLGWDLLISCLASSQNVGDIRCSPLIDKDIIRRRRRRSEWMSDDRFQKKMMNFYRCFPPFSVFFPWNNLDSFSLKNKCFFLLDVFWFLKKVSEVHKEFRSDSDCKVQNMESISEKFLFIYKT